MYVKGVKGGTDLRPIPPLTFQLFIYETPLPIISNRTMEYEGYKSGFLVA